MHFETIEFDDDSWCVSFEHLTEKKRHVNKNQSLVLKKNTNTYSYPNLFPLYKQLYELFCGKQNNNYKNNQSMIMGIGNNTISHFYPNFKNDYYSIFNHFGIDVARNAIINDFNKVFNIFTEKRNLTKLLDILIEERNYINNSKNNVIDVTDTSDEDDIDNTCDTSDTSDTSDEDENEEFQKYKQKWVNFKNANPNYNAYNYDGMIFTYPTGNFGSRYGGDSANAQPRYLIHK